MTSRGSRADTGTSVPPLPARSFRGWRVVKAAAGIQFLQSGLYLNVFSDYAVVLREQFGWGRSTLTFAFSMTRAESGLLGPLQGWMVERFGPKRVIRIGAVLFTVGWLLLSQMNSLWQFFAFYFAIAVGASLSGFLTLTSAMVNWFRRRRATALTLGQAGFAIGGLLTPLVAWYLSRYGWRSAAVLTGLFGGTAMFIIARWVEYRPSDVGEHVDGQPDDQDLNSPGSQYVTLADFTVREAMRTKAFWLISFGHATALLVVSAVLANRALYLQEQRGWSHVEAGFVGAGIVAFQFVGMILGGLLGDRIDKRYIAAAAMLGHSVGIVLFAHGSSTWMIWLFVPLHGTAWGARGPLMQALRADYFGPTYFPSIMGYSSLIVMLGMMSGGIFAAGAADRMDGNYTPGFTVLGVIVAFGAIWFLTLKPPIHPSLVEADMSTDEVSLPSSSD